MNTRYRTVTLQAIGVAVLAAVIFVAFLRPSEPSDLSGIEARGGHKPPTASTSQHADKRRHRHSGRERPKHSSGRQGHNSGMGPSGAGSTGNASGTDSVGGGESTPAGSQYGDVVTRLLKEVGTPAALAKFGRAP